MFLKKKKRIIKKKGSKLVPYYFTIIDNSFSFVTYVSFDTLGLMPAPNINVDVHVNIKVNGYLSNVTNSLQKTLQLDACLQ
jgi:hypothetical protein